MKEKSKKLLGFLIRFLMSEYFEYCHQIRSCKTKPMFDRLLVIGVYEPLLA